jgi:hypothetical protein
MDKKVKTAMLVAGKVLVCAAVYVVAAMAAGMVLPKVGIQPPTLPEQVEAEELMPYFFLGALALSALMAPLAGLLRGRYLQRLTCLFVFATVCLAVNTAIEASIFTTVSHVFGVVAHQIVPLLAFSAVLAAVFGAERAEGFSRRQGRLVPAWTPQQWAARIAIAVVAFPAIYLLFGTAVAPFVVDHYRQGAFGLTLPPMGVIVAVQFVRSVLFLAASLGVLMMLSGSRHRRILSFALAFFVLTGLFEMLQAYWLPEALRLAHGLELLADSVVYAIVMVIALSPRAQTDARIEPVVLKPANC